MKKLLTLSLLVLITAGISQGAVVDLLFNQTSGTYTEITGGTALISGSFDDETFNTPIGFTFNANGINFTNMNVSCNGYVYFHSTSTGSLGYSPISTTSTATMVVSAMGRDLQSNPTATLRVETTGTAPNRITTIQWKDVKRYGTSYAGEILNFQIKLYETLNKVDIIYGSITGSSYSSAIHPQVGIRGVTNADFKNRTTTTDWTASTQGTLNNDIMTLNNLVFPPSGLTFTYTVPAPGPAVYTSPLNGVIGVPLDAVINWTAPVIGGAPSGYRVYFGTDNPPTNIANGIDVGNVLSYDPTPDLAVNTVYYWQVIPYNGTGVSPTNQIWSFTSTLGIGDLQGFVTNGFGVPMGGVQVVLGNQLGSVSTVSAPNGSYSFTGVTAANFTLTANLAGYNTTTIPVYVAPMTITYQNIVMTRPSMAITPNPYNVAVNPNEMLDGAINITNNGDGTLGWNATISFTSPGPNTWLTLSQATGTVNPYSNFNLPVFFNAAGIPSGTIKTAEITFVSTPNVGTVVVPVTMTVTGTELIAPSNLNAVLSNPINGVVSLTWSYQTAAGFQFFVIKRDGAQIGTSVVNNFSNTLPGYGVYSYTVQAVYADGSSAPAGPVSIEWANPVLALDPTSLYNEQYPNTSENVSFRIYNNGEGTLVYSFPEYLDSRGAGGPDAFGYEWIDSDEPGGPAYVWNDISSTGTLVTGLSDDNVVGPYNIGFEFPFYENTYNSVNVSSNGYLIFGSTVSSLSNQDIPNTSTPNNVIAWCWDDLHGAGTGSTVHYQNMGDHWVIQFTNYHEYPSTGTGTITAQVHLYQNGNVFIYYNNTAGGFDLLGNTVGIENNAGTIATKVSYDASYIHNSLALQIKYPVYSFITAVNPAQGQVPAGGFVDVTATFTSDEDYPVGTHNVDLELNTNDLNNEVVMIPATMVVYEPGMLTGTVTSAVDGSPIFGASVVAGTYSTMTDENGNYSIIADAGTYTMTFSKTGYSSVTVADVVVTETQTTVVDAVLEEGFYPPTLVHAVVNDIDTQTDVTWGTPHPDYEILFDDGSAENYTAWALPGNMNAVKFTPAGYPATVYGGKIYVGDGSFPNNNTGFIGTTFGAMVMDASGANGMPGAVLDSIEVTVNNYGWVEFSGLNATIESGSFYLVMVQGAVSPNVAGVGVDQTTPTSYRSYSRNVVAGGAWGLSPYQDMMIRALVSGPASDDAATVASTDVRVPVKQIGMISLLPATAQSGAEGEGSYLAVQGQSSREVISYSIWRVLITDPDQGPDSGVQTLLNDEVPVTNYTDAAFGSLAEGWYAYAVAAHYTNGGISEKAYSNIVGHKKLVTVTANVGLSTGGSPQGALVVMTGFDYPYTVFSETVPAEGTIVFEDVSKGHYRIIASMVGFDNYVYDANIQSNRIFDIVLGETKYAPTNLYVDPLTLVATWRAPLATKLTEDFEGADFPPAGWSSYTQNNNGWYAGTVGSSAFVIPPHTTFAVANDDEANGDGCCDYLWTPELNLVNSESYVLNFQSFFNGTYGQTSYVEISTDNGASWTVVQTMSPATSWQQVQVDLTDYAGPSGLSSAWIGFHTNDNGAWASGWAIDDVTILYGVNPSMGYGVFLDGTLVDNTMETTYTYTNLIYGQQYLAGVAGLFTSGYSEMDTYLFRSVYLIPPTDLAAESPIQTNYVHLTWVAPTVPTDHMSVTPIENAFANAESDVNAKPRVISPNRTIWDIHYNFDMDNPSGLTGLAGAESDGQFIYAPRWSGSEIAKFDVAGNYIETFSIPGVSGLRDLAFDGTYMYGSAATTTVYKMDFTAHTLVSSFTAPTAVRAIAYDTDDHAFYANNWDTDMIKFDETGAQLASYPNMPSLYGVAYDNFSEGGPYLWFFTGTVTGGGCQVEQYDLTNMTLTGISHSVSNDFGDYIAGGLYITTDLISGKVILGGTAQGTPDLAFGYELGDHSGGGPTVANLLGYDIYRDNNFVAYVEKPALEYFDQNLDPGTYSYDITAVYDLTPYGYAGQTGESMMEGPVSVNVIYGYQLPFVEEFTSGVFTTNGWTVDGANWHIAGQAGNPAPSAEFTYSPAQTDYALALTSSWINGFGADNVEFIDGDIYLDFDLKLDDNTATGDEKLTVEVYNGTSWATAANITAEGDQDWELQHIKITNSAKNKVFRVRFVANGVNSLDINNWQIDNIHIYRLCAAPTNLDAYLPDAENHGDQIRLTWEAPSSPVVISGWLKWDDGSNAGNGVGLTAGGTFLAAARFTPEQLTAWAGTSLTKIRMFPYSANGCTFILKVWTGANAGTLVVSQPITFVSDQWNEYSLNTPVYVTGTTELWFGYQVTHAAGQYPGGTDAGPAVAGFGDMISTDGTTWDPMSTFDLNYNWNIEGFVETLDGATQLLQPIVNNTVYNNASSTLAMSPVTNVNNPNATVATTTSSSRELTGYNIFRDDTFIATTTETSYLDTDPDISHFGEEYCYKVTAVYTDCESDFSNTDCERVVDAQNISLSAVNIYPNPSNSVVNIEVTNTINQVVIYNYAGQVVYQQMVTKDKNIQIDVRNYNAGAYLVKFITRSGESFAKKVAVTK